MRLWLVLSVVMMVNGCWGYSTAARRSYKDSSIRYYTRPTKQINITVKVHFDKVLTDRLAKDHRIKKRKDLKDISRMLMKDVEAYFRHSSLNQSIHISILDTKFIKQSILEMDDDGSKYLKNYCTKQGYLKRKSRQWWYSIMITGKDLFFVNAKGEKVRTSTARGYMNGICAIDKSCTLIEWNNRNIGYLLAHEIGHSLGITHDGVPFNECKPWINIMSHKYHSRLPPRSWSRCSKRQLEWFLRSDKAACLHTNPTS